MQFFLKSKIHRARVTEARVDYEGSITIDAELMDLAGLRIHEKVLVASVDTGARVETYAIEGKRHSGVICMNGAAARVVSEGELVIIMAFAGLDERAALNHHPKVVFVDEANRPIAAENADPLTYAFRAAVSAGLAEDLTATGDITTSAVVGQAVVGSAEVIAVQPGVLCGVRAFAETYQLVDNRVHVTELASDGDRIVGGQTIATIEGPVASVLSGERNALNLVSHLSGVATLTSQFVSRAPGVVILETRKTLPGLRFLEKYAVRCGGGTNHRMSLSDAVLIKDNHIAVSGSVEAAVTNALELYPEVQVECDSEDQLLEALKAGATSVLLDNFDPAELKRIVGLAHELRPHVVLEASGGITLDNISTVASTGVDRISIGALTHSAPALDMSLRVLV